MLLVSFSYGSKTTPQKIEGKDGDKYILPRIDITSLLLPHVLDNWGEGEEIRIDVIEITRSFREEVMEFKDREAMERENDEN
jgi:hypothetical protein